MIDAALGAFGGIICGGVIVLGMIALAAAYALTGMVALPLYWMGLWK